MSRVALLGLLTIVTFSVACGGASSGGTDNTDDALRHAAPPVTSTEDAQKAADDALTALLAQTEPLTEQRADAITVAAIGPTVTLKRMKLANVWAAEEHAQGEGFDRIVYAISVLYMGAPRDLSFTPSGQSFEASHAVDSEGAIEPIALKVIGTASAAYTLDFHVAGHALSVAVPKGSTASKTAHLISDAITHDKRAIENTWSSSAAIGGGDTRGYDDWSIDVDGATVTVSISING